MVRFVFVLILCSCADPSTTVMTFNVRWDDPSDGPNRWVHRMDFVVSSILETDPDLLATQEATWPQVRDLIRELPEYYFLVESTDEDQADSAIFWRSSRYELLEKEHFWMSPTPKVPFSTFPGDGYNPPRTTSCALLRDRFTGENLRFCGTHWSGGFGEESALLTKEVLGEKSPTILAGDFNAFPFRERSWPSSPEWLRDAQSPAYDVLTSFLVDGFRRLHPDNAQVSGCGWHPTCPDYGLDLRVDWILHTPDLETVSSEILVLRKDGRNVSDHWPVVSTLEVSR